MVAVSDSIYEKHSSADAVRHRSAEICFGAECQVNRFD
jgi:hypothetical protein